MRGSRDSWTRRQVLGLAAGALVVSRAAAPAQESPAIPLDEATIADLQRAMDAGRLTAEALVRRCLSRIQAFDRQGPTLRAVLTLDPGALDTARALDAERRQSGRRSPLHGIPVLLKDNIDTADLPTTAGSLALEGSTPAADAFLVRRLRDAGAVVLGKTNLSEFASGPAVSSLGGQMRNPHDTARTPLGSSGGSGIAVAAAYAVAAIGTDTGGSIRNPASTCGIVGLKPTRGLISRRGVVPLALTFDTAGPLARHVADVAALLTVLAGADDADEATHETRDRIAADYTAFLDGNALGGARLGLARDFLGQDADVDWVIESAVASLRGQGAEVVDVRLPSWLLAAKGGFYDAIRYPEFKAQIADYLRARPGEVPRDVHQLLARVSGVTTPRPDGGGPNPARWNLLRREAAAADLADPHYRAVRDHALPLVRSVIDGVLSSQRLDAIVYPTLPTRPPLLTAPPNPPGGAAGTPANLANLTGYPDLVVPAGLTADGLPVTVSFLGPAFSEGRLLALGYAFERATRARRLPRHTPLLPGDIVPR